MTTSFVRLLALGLLLIVPAASAHEPFEITTNVRVFSDRITLNVLITDTTAARLCLSGATMRSRLHDAELAASRAIVERCAAGLFVVSDGATPLAPRDLKLRLTEEKDLDVTLSYPSTTSNMLRIDAVHLKRLPDSTYGATVTVTDEHRFLAQKLLRADDSVLEVSLDSAQPARQSSFSEFFKLGIEHILTGYDHLLFLAGLLIVCVRLRTALIIITAFTLAHSMTLALAALDVVSLPSRIVEPVIAATIVFVGIENLWRARQGREVSGRWMLAFAFGLMHGFGFASALQEAGLPHGGWQLVSPLLAFNLGVETGQLAVAAIFLPLLFFLRRYTWFARGAVPLISIAVAGAGLFWFLERVTGLGAS
jgi:hydrogenase/urease accessory protein HupE